MFWSKPKTKVTCVGSVSKDVFFPNNEGVFVDTPEDLASPKKVQFILGGKVLVPDRFDDIGGVAANVAIGLSKLGHKTRLVSRIGDDEVGDFISNELKKTHVSREALITLQNTPSDLSAILVFMQTGERTIFHNRDANERLHVTPNDLKLSEWVFVSALNGEWQHNIDIIRENKAKLGYKIALNPGQHNLKTDLNCMREFLKHVDILMLNHEEAVLLLGKEQPELLKDEKTILEALAKLGPTTIGLTDGPRGAWAYQNGLYKEQKPEYVERVVDSTGAGDSFASGFLAALLYEMSLEVALSWGIKNSAANLKQYGATRGLLMKDDILK
jgi:ribokinase